MEETYIHCFLLLLWAISAAHGQSCANTNPSPSSVCSSIESSLGRCAAYYMHSIFPNNVSYSQDEALQGYERYRVFAEFGCSVYADVYICLALAPLCNPPLPLPRPPCTSFCNNVTAQCNDAISARGGFGFDIYCLLECNRYPDSDATGSNCVAMDDPLLREISASPPASDPATTLPVNVYSTWCPFPSETSFSDSAKQFALGWGSVLCFISSTLIIFTFLLDTSAS